MQTFDFSEALKRVKAGKRVAKMSWGSRGMFIFLVPGSVFKVNRAPLLGIYPEGTEITYHAHIDMRIESGVIVPWVASHYDVLGEDWVEVP
jgi:hypothetical protein